MRTRFVPTLALLVGTALVAAAQEPPAPRGTAKTIVNGSPVTVEYGRPALKGRTIDSLLAQLDSERIWRAGVNQVTTLTTGTDLLIGGKKVAKGKYSLYLHCPADGNWSLVVNSDLGVPLSKIWAAAPANLANEPWPHLAEYQKNAGAKEVTRAALKKADAATTAEQFTISFSPAKDGATLNLAWGNQTWSVDVKGAK
jgi:hypothetical protein